MTKHGTEQLLMAVALMRGYLRPDHSNGAGILVAMNAAQTEIATRLAEGRFLQALPENLEDYDA